MEALKHKFGKINTQEATKYIESGWILAHKRNNRPYNDCYYLIDPTGSNFNFAKTLSKGIVNNLIKNGVKINEQKSNSKKSNKKV